MKEPATTYLTMINLDEIYEECFIDVARIISKHGGTVEDARDIFHDALLLMENQLAAGRVIESERAYLAGIARYLMHQRFRANAKSVRINDVAEPATYEDRFPDEHRIVSLLRQAGQRCLDLLTAAFIERKSMREIADAFLLSSEHSASVQKYKCLEKIRETIRSKQLSYEDFLE